MKVNKDLVIWMNGKQFKSVHLTVTDVDSYDDADFILAEEINSKYFDLISDEDLVILRKQNKYIKERK